MIHYKTCVRCFKILVPKCTFDEFAKGRVHFVFGFLVYILRGQFCCFNG